MSLSVQKINLDLTIIRFEIGMTPNDFAKELSGVIGKDVWRYTQNVYLNGTRSEYIFYCGMGSNEQKYSVLEDGAILIDNTTKCQVGGYSNVGGEEIKSSIGDNFKDYEITICLLKNDHASSEENLINLLNSEVKEEAIEDEDK